jgi:hypothetical protein
MRALIDLKHALNEVMRALHDLKRASIELMWTLNQLMRTSNELMQLMISLNNLRYLQLFEFMLIQRSIYVWWLSMVCGV